MHAETLAYGGASKSPFFRGWDAAVILMHAVYLQAGQDAIDTFDSTPLHDVEWLYQAGYSAAVRSAQNA